MLNYSKVPGHCGGTEVKKLQELCEGKVVLEIGSFKGKSSVAIAEVSKTLHCIDTFKANDTGQVQKGDTLEIFKQSISGYTNIEYFVGKSADMVPLLGDDFYDVVFIDAMHTFKNVKEDIVVSIPKLKESGMFVFHDYTNKGWPDVAKAVKHMFDENHINICHDGVGGLGYVCKIYLKDNDIETNL